MKEENIEKITKSDSNVAPTFADHYLLPDINFNGHCLIKSSISIPKKVINLSISYKLNPQLRNKNTDFSLNSCLLGSVKLNKNADVDKYVYAGYVIGFDLRSELSLPDGSMENNVIIFGADVSSSVHINNVNKDIVILDEVLTQRLDDSALTIGDKYLINFPISGKKILLSLHYNGSNSFLFVNATKIDQFKVKDG